VVVAPPETAVVVVVVRLLKVCRNRLHKETHSQSSLAAAALEALGETTMSLTLTAGEPTALTVA
jgi:hypothetical protein